MILQQNEDILRKSALNFGVLGGSLKDLIIQNLPKVQDAPNVVIFLVSDDGQNVLVRNRPNPPKQQFRDVPICFSDTNFDVFGRIPFEISSFQYLGFSGCKIDPELDKSATYFYCLIVPQFVLQDLLTDVNLLLVKRQEFASIAEISTEKLKMFVNDLLPPIFEGQDLDEC